MGSAISKFDLHSQLVADHACNPPRDGILKGTRGPGSGYEVAREQAKITAEDILNSAGRIEEADEPLPESELMVAIIQPALAIAERSFSAALREISLADLVR